MAGKFHHEEIFRGPATIAMLSRLRIVICGAGALGSNLADMLVRMGAAWVHVIDHDRVEEHNIGTQIYSQSDIGLPKADALRKHLFRIAGVEADAVRKELTAANARTLLKDADLIVDTFDNSASRAVVQQHARAAAVPTIHAGLFADYGEVVWDEIYRVPKDAQRDACNYPLARTLVLLTTLIAAETVVRFVSQHDRKSWSITLHDLAVRPME